MQKNTLKVLVLGNILHVYILYVFPIYGETFLIIFWHFGFHFAF
jgi:hypothetical protein